MRFQITFKIHPEDHFVTNAVFIVDAQNWQGAACQSTLLKQALGLNPEQVVCEIVYASKEEDMIRAGSLVRVETVHTFPSPDLKIIDLEVNS